MFHHDAPSENNAVPQLKNQISTPKARERNKKNLRKNEGDTANALLECLRGHLAEREKQEVIQPSVVVVDRPALSMFLGSFSFVLRSAREVKLKK